MPGDDLAANLIGFTSQDMVGVRGWRPAITICSWQQAGVRGLGDLGRADSRRLQQDDPGQRRGSSLTLTIDRDLQFRCQQILSAGMAGQRGATAAAVIIDVATGEVRAQASDPTDNAAKPFPSDPVAREDAATSFVV